MSTHDDLEEYARTHREIFGHLPITNLQTGQGCIHPMHDQLQRMISSPGVDLEIDFSPHGIITEDDEIAITANTRYQNEVNYWKEQFKEWEEEDNHKKRFF